jgi:hypothetical protein
MDGNEYELDPSDLTVSRLRQMKHWFGKEYGAYLPFVQLLLQGDADAVACTMWIVRTKAGESNVPEPRFMDFSVADFFVAPEGDDEDPPTEDAPTPVSRKKSKV